MNTDAQYGKCDVGVSELISHEWAWNEISEAQCVIQKKQIDYLVEDFELGGRICLKWP